MKKACMHTHIHTRGCARTDRERAHKRERERESERARERERAQEREREKERKREREKERKRERERETSRADRGAANTECMPHYPALSLDRPRSLFLSFLSKIPLSALGCTLVSLNTTKSPPPSPPPLSTHRNRARAHASLNIAEAPEVGRQ